MRTRLIIFFFLSTTLAYGQYDDLLHQGFNSNYPVLMHIYDSLEQQQDSAGIWKVMDDVAALAHKEHDTELELLAGFIECRYAAMHSPDADYVDSVHTLLIRKATRLKNYKMMAFTEFNLGAYYWLHKVNYELSLEHYLNSYQHLQQVKDEEFMFKQGEIYTVGEKYFVFNDYHNAQFYLHKSLQVKNPFDSGFVVSVLNTMGMSFNAQNMLDSAEYYFRQALQQAEQLNLQNWIGNLSGNIGGVYYKRGDKDEAMRWVRRDIDCSMRNNAPGPASGAYLLAAMINFDQDHPLLAIAQIDSAMELMGSNRPEHRLRVLYPMQSKRFAYLGDWKKASAYLDSSLMIRDTIAAKTSAVHLMRVQQKTDLIQHRSEIEKMQNAQRIRTLQRNVMLGILALALAGGGLLYRQKRKTDRARKRSDELLLNILPANVAAELKASGESRARRFSEVTVLFSDFKDFTRHSEALGPEELVRILDGYFKAFDQIMVRHGLEKIKTVGDAYICACGIPDPQPNHAERVIAAALEMQAFMRGHADGWQLRIGVHSGPVVAGIVGIKKFAYDIWGDTVNTAARMEQNSEAGQINISQVTYELVKHSYPCAHRGMLDVKNKGAMDMYFVLQ